MFRMTFFSVLLLACLPAGAQTMVPHDDEHEQQVVRAPALSLSRAVDAALDRAPGGALPQARRAESRTLSARADSVLSGPPAVHVRYQTDRLPGRAGLRELEAGLELLLWRAGQRDALRREAEAGSQLSQEELRAHRWRVAGEVREVLWRVMQSEAEQRLAGIDVELYRALEDDVARRVSAGDAAPVERLSAEAARRERDAVLHEAQVELAHSLFAWHTLTGMHEVPATVREPRAGEASGYPPVVTAQAALERARMALGSLRGQGSGAPRLLIGVRSETAPDSPTTDSLGATLTIPFGGEAHTAAALSPAYMELARAEDELAAAQRAATLALHEAEHELHAREQAQRLADAQGAVADREVDMARRAYRLGETSLAERLLVEARAASARRAAALAGIAFERAIARYNHSLGILP
ncbi:MAG: TolC family protein [Gammaproteobacteria bacterium]|nr:TolC family protein [Gammaproteobacteria bacterium]MBU0770992.1 TolC family protein [Gammaproteobacteria bacterium]MBU0857790.1 TolC family protein [Gammaproteobacteria bacterium]MBU1846056.1 TolC family protein [Gammaproteobacteria bacterium]